VKSVPTLDHEEAEDVTSIALHPAARAWRKLTNRQVVPESVEIIQERVRRPDEIYRMTGEPSVYRLTGVAPDGTNVIAKRCESAAASTECLIYQNVLPYLPVSALRYYGLVADDDRQFCWLLLEDAGEEPYLLDVEEHRVLAGHWLGVMNVSAQQLRAATRLPDRGLGFYFKRLLASRETIRAIVEKSTFSDRDVTLLRALISHCDALQRQWEGIAQFCNRMPRTLVHGDFAIQNARLRSGPAGNNLLLMDWEGAGWGSPAADLAQFVGGSLSPDLRTYHSVVCSTWPGIALADLERLAEFGRMFRLISSLDWANSGYRALDADWYLEEVSYYEEELTDWLRTQDK
jgi:aminoglycoside/choline kinase family phosphotransferase